MTAKKQTRQHAGLFKPGNQMAKKGNGKRVKSRILATVGEEGIQDLIDKEYELAKAGDAAARTFILSRVAEGQIKPTHGKSTFDLDLSKGVENAVTDILAAIASGQLNVEQGQAMMGTLKAGADISAMAQMQQKLAMLEDRLNDASTQSTTSQNTSSSMLGKSNDALKITADTDWIGASIND